VSLAIKSSSCVKQSFCCTVYSLTTV